MCNILVALAALATIASPALAHPQLDDMPQCSECKPMNEIAVDLVTRMVFLDQ